MKETVHTEIGTVVKKVGHVVESTEKVFEPMRRSLFTRFPITLTLLATFGVVATFYGTERLISEVSWLNEHPSFILLSGIVTLAFTGKLYQKLG